MTENLAASYVQIDVSQNLTVSAGNQYNFAAKSFETDTQDGPETFVEAFVDDQMVAQSKASDAAKPPVVWKSLAGTFTAGPTGTAALRVSFIARDFLSIQWGLDNVVVTPA